MHRSRMATLARAASLTIAGLTAFACGDHGSPTAPQLAPGVSAGKVSTNAGVNLDQWANGKASASVAASWQNGDLNKNNSAYAEGRAVPFRAAVEGLVVGTTHTIILDYDWTAGGHEAYDFLASVDATEDVTSQLCAVGGGGVSSLCVNGAMPAGVPMSEFPLPGDAYGNGGGRSVDGAIAASSPNVSAKRKLRVYGGTITSISATSHAGPVDANSSARVLVTFTATSSGVLLAWSGHLAQSSYWNGVADPDGAGQVSGAPWHMRTLNLDGGGAANQDRSIQPSAIVAVPDGIGKMALSPLTATNGIGEDHVVTATVSRDDQIASGGDGVAGFGPVPDGTLVTFSLLSNTANAVFKPVGANTCTTTSGVCSITIASTSAGSVSIHATSTFTSGPTTVVASTSTGLSSADAQKTYVAGTVRWIKHDGSGALLGGAVFTVCRTDAWSSTLNAGAGGYVDVDPDVCFDVTDDVSGTNNTSAAPADRDGTAGEFELGGLVLGKYTVKEKTAPAGYVLDPDTETADVSTSTASVTIATAFVDVAPDAYITIGTTATNTVGDPHTFTATMTVVPNGGSPVDVPAFTIAVSPAPSTPGTTACGAFDASTNSRTCTRTINSNVAGTFTANATASATVGGVTLNRDTDPSTGTVSSGTGGSGPAVKTYIAPKLSITKTPDLATDAGGSVQPGGRAEFTITVSNSAAAGTGTANGVVMVDTLPAALSWTEKVDKAECTIDQVTVNAVSRDRITCNIGSLVAGASFAVTVQSNVIPSSFIQLPPSPSGSAIEIDGDLVNGALPGADWGSLPASTFSCTSTPRKGCDIDLPTGKNDNSFGQGTKEDDGVPTVVSGAIPNNKSDLLRFYVASQRFVTTDFLYLAWSRVQEPNGTTNMDFELNQSKLLSSNGVTPVRTAGDILIRYDLAQGGTVPKLGYHKWITQGSASLCEASNSVPCWDKKRDLTIDVQAAINSAAVTEPIAGGTLSARTFGEASIDLQASGIFAGGVCRNFGQAYLKSRSSDSFTSEVKDFIAPIPIAVTNCAPVTINNLAWASASNFAPSGGNLGDGISDAGKVEVSETASASLGVAPAWLQAGELVARTERRLEFGRVVPSPTAGVATAASLVLDDRGEQAPARRAAAAGDGAAASTGGTVVT